MEMNTNEVEISEYNSDVINIEYGDGPFDEDMVNGVLKTVFKDHLSFVTWGYW